MSDVATATQTNAQGWSGFGLVAALLMSGVYLSLKGDGTGEDIIALTLMFLALVVPAERRAHAAN